MNLAEFEKDLEGIKQTLEQTLANANVLIGQRQALEAVVAKIKGGAQAVEAVATTVEKVADAVEQVVDTSPASTN